MSGLYKHNVNLKTHYLSGKPREDTTDDDTDDLEAPPMPAMSKVKKEGKTKSTTKPKGKAKSKAAPKTKAVSASEVEPTKRRYRRRRPRTDNLIPYNVKGGASKGLEY